MLGQPRLKNHQNVQAGSIFNLKLEKFMNIFFLAYVDPGVGALAWQMVISAFVGVLFYLKATRNWVVKTLLRMFRLKQIGTGLQLENSLEEKDLFQNSPAPAGVPALPQRNSTCSKPA